MAMKKNKNKGNKKKPKHSLDDKNRNSNSQKHKQNNRTGATIRRLKMYKSRPKRDRKGKILTHEYQSKDLPCTRIQPDRRYFANTRVISQKDLEVFREEMQKRKSSNYNVIVGQNKLPISLLNNKKVKGNTS